MSHQKWWLTEKYCNTLSLKCFKGIMLFAAMCLDQLMRILLGQLVRLKQCPRAAAGGS